MQQSVDVFLLGDPPEAQALTIGPLIVNRMISTKAKSIAEFAEPRLAAQLMEGPADLVAISADASREALKTLAAKAISLGSDPAASLTIDRLDAGLKHDPTWLLSSELDIIRAARAGHGPPIIRRSKLRQIGPLRPVAEPVWDWMIRAILAGERLEITPHDQSKSDFSRLPLLVPPRPGSQYDWLREHLVTFSPEHEAQRTTSNSAAKAHEIAMRAGLFQWHDFLDESHELSQSIEGQGEHLLGDYWHAIMHRREPDYANAKYWFRRIGNQPTYRDLRQHAVAVLSECRDPQAAVWRDRLEAGSQWNPLAFVDLCEECAHDEKSELAIAARRIQYAEMCFLR
jgi:hypothetical protein